MNIKLLSFWDGLYTSPFLKDYVKYFEHIFDTEYIKTNYDTIEVWCCGGNGPTIELSNLEKNILRVQFTGESYYHDITKFHLSFIPALENKHKHKNTDVIDTTYNNTVIPSTLANSYLNIHNLLDRFSNRNVWEQNNHRSRRFCSFIVSNGGPVLRRQMFAKLIKHKHIDSMGRYGNNCNHMNIPECDTDEYFAFLHNWRFMLCFENTDVDYYLTEKVLNAYIGGCIPIYWGCPQVKQILNEKAIILLEDTSEESMNKLCNRIMELENDENKYREMYEQPLFINNEIPKDFKIDYLQNLIVEKLKN